MVENHAAATGAGRRLRVARVRCTQCGVRRAFHFVLGAPTER